MNNRQFLLGAAAGLMIGGAAAAAMGVKKAKKTGLGRTLKTMGRCPFLFSCFVRRTRRII